MAHEGNQKITARLDVKLKKLASLYHCIRIFIKLWQGENDPNDNIKFRFDNIYDTI